MLRFFNTLSRQVEEFQPIEDNKVRNLSPATQRSYVHAVAKFSRLRLLA